MFEQVTSVYFNLSFLPWTDKIVSTELQEAFSIYIINNVTCI